MATTTMETMTSKAFESTDYGNSSMEDLEDASRHQHSDSSFLPMPLHHIDSLQLIPQAAFLHRGMTKLLSPSKTPAVAIMRIPKLTTRKMRSNLLELIPKEVLAKDILGFLTDKGVKVFFDSLGKERIKSPSFSLLRNQFCLKHGSRLEDQASFQMGILSKPGSRKRCCPECHSEQQNVKRCHGCKVFYPASRDPNDNMSTNKSFPGLWCQSCDHMAFCKTCLSNENNGCGSAILASVLQQSPAAFGRKHRLGGNNNQNQFFNGRASCHNYCCSNIFTNTMCGEFVCLDCGDENQKLLRDNQEQEHLAVETCEKCGKSTCLDPNCLVCADFKLIHMSCKFSAEDAYSVDITNISPNVRRKISDCLVWMLVFMALSKMWWFQQQQQMEQEF
eukprot:CAMPEP_0116138714 /NCGR_PEP_ID=MMETSP0329-20121206/12924_1 /TAXON_ID=697910 /ORGANISM="Pseudo-nitzschia arenysensis, Strain B593" /LENGTH=389 /DNA_ID=CAMNT_0003633705 /DNA_START=65 /DNA_END=1234 /DNA_ORIENTATION=-